MPRSSVIRLWNSLPTEIVRVQSPRIIQDSDYGLVPVYTDV